MRRFLLILGVSVTFLQCKSSKSIINYKYVASIQNEGFIDCFEEGLNEGKINCEASAILYDGNKTFIANDKDMPDSRSSVFYYSNSILSFDSSSRHYLSNPIFKKATKYEDFAITPSKKYIFLSTAFDRAKSNSNEWDGYNTILYWKNGNEEDPKILGSNNSSSVGLRKDISKALANSNFKDGMPYFKIEGIAATDNKIYLGVREIGKSFQEPLYVVKILEIPYTIKGDNVVLGNMRLCKEFNNPQLNSLHKNLGLSSIEFDSYNNRFLLLTSYEDGNNFGAYLWSFTEKELENGVLNIVKDKTGNPLFFDHKAEDLTVISKNLIYVIHDDDRVKTKIKNVERKQNQAAFSVVRIN